MASRSSFDRPTRTLTTAVRAIAVAALVTLYSSCSFMPDEPLNLQQVSVDSVALQTDVFLSVGAVTVHSPRLAFAYLTYFTQPSKQYIVDAAQIDSLPGRVVNSLFEILPPSYLNRGFALGYGDYALGTALVLAYDDLNDDRAYTAGEPIVGSSRQEI